MKKAIYLFRKYIGYILLIIFFIIVLIMLYKTPKYIKKHITALLIIFLLLIIFTFSCYPYRSIYCACGRKYDIKNGNCVGEKRQQKIDNDFSTTFFKHYAEIECICFYCKRKHYYKETLNGGFKKENIKTQEIINRRISFEEAIDEYLSN